MKVRNLIFTAIIVMTFLVGCSSPDSKSQQSSEVVISFSESAESTAKSSATDQVSTSDTVPNVVIETTASSDVPVTEIPDSQSASEETDQSQSQPVETAEPTEPSSESANPTETSAEIVETTQTSGEKETKEVSPIYDIVNAQYAQTNDGRQNCYAYDKTQKALPCINIATQDGQPVLSLTDYIPSVVDVYNCDAQFELSANAQVKVRGNSSAQGDEKPYRIKFDHKQSMLGLHDGKKYKSWVLLRTYWNVVPDFTAFKLGKTIFRGEYYVSDATYVNVYINNQYKGVYLLCEQNQAAKDRIDVNEAKEGDASLNIGYVLELGGSSEHPSFSLWTSEYVVTDITGTSRSVESTPYSIRSDINTEDQKKFIANYTAGVFKILYEASMNNNPMMFDANYNVVSAAGIYTAYQAVEAVFDVKSVAETLILEELCHDNDVGEGSFYIAIDFSADSKYKKVTFCAPWDFSWAYTGDAYGGYYACTFQPMVAWGDNSNPWLIMFMRIPEFQQLVKSIWAEVKEPVVQTTNWIDMYVDTLAGDYAGYMPNGVASAHKLQKFVRGRVEWLSGVWG